jgi:hypothetical protein
MIDFRTAKMLAHRRNIERYCRLLTTEFTDVERQYLHKRIAAEHTQLERLEKRQAEQQADGNSMILTEQPPAAGFAEVVS